MRPAMLRLRYLQPTAKAPLFAIALPLFGLLALTARAANPFLHPLFTNNMVLQRDMADPIWGWATPGNTVSVSLSGPNSATYTATASATDGRWQITMGAFPVGGPYTVTISSSGQTTQTLTNVMMGDVYLCSGQSNMAFSSNSIGVLNVASEVADSANYPNIRFYTVPTVLASTPQSTYSATNWLVAGPSTTGNFSATGYFTAREISKRLPGVPIGVLVSAVGGTTIATWLDQPFTSTFGDFIDPLYDQTGEALSIGSVSAYYNGMITPLLPFNIKGVVWYQGEQDVGTPDEYTQLLPHLITNLRTIFSQPGLPVIVIQLANYNLAQTVPVETGSWAELRDVQFNTTKNDANSRMVSAIDDNVNNVVRIHPLDKQDVGMRAALAAMNLVYGQNITNQGPAFTGATIAGNTVRCSFNNVAAGLMAATKDPLTALGPATPAPTGTLTGFALAGSDDTFYSASATIDPATNTVLVSSPQVPAPVTVRYGWGSCPPCNLYNEITDGSGNVINGLPASPFRNDPVYKLNVVSGSGTGYYALNSSTSISATTVAGLTFDHWAGDTTLLGNANAATTTVKIAKSYVSAVALYRPTGAPTGLFGTASQGQNTIAWTSMGSGVHYNISRATSSSGPYTTLVSNFVGSHYTDTTVADGVTYYYEISASTQLGTGPVSSPLKLASLLYVQNFQNCLEEWTDRAHLERAVRR